MPQTVLLLDDEQVNIILMEESLRRHLPEVTTIGFVSPAEALAWCADHEPDLCLIDYKMPGMSGIEFLTRVRSKQNFEGIPVVMITGVSTSDARQAALRSGVTEFLSKPINPDEVILRVRNLLNLRSGMQKQLTGFEWLQRKVEAMPRGAVSQEYERIIRQLCRFSEIRDEETGTHMHRMAAIAQLIAREMGADGDYCDRILLAAPMHDIGKVGIPDKILLKPGRLDIQEWSVMKTHATIGYDFLKGSESPLLKMGADIAHAHHEKFNGEGYPQQLKGDTIPMSGRIVAVADVFDALVNVRPYKAAWDFGDAFNLLRRERGQHFDPDCVDAMLLRIDGVLEIQRLHSELSGHSGGPHSFPGAHRAVGG